MDADSPTETPKLEEPAASGSLADLCPFKRVMAANRGEIAVRINRAATELNLDTVSIYAYEGKPPKNVQFKVNFSTIIS